MELVGKGMIVMHQDGVYVEFLPVFQVQQAGQPLHFLVDVFEELLFPLLRGLRLLVLGLCGKNRQQNGGASAQQTIKIHNFVVQAS